MPDDPVPSMINTGTTMRALEIRAGTDAIQKLKDYSRTGLQPDPTPEQMAIAVLKAADQVRAGTWVDPNPPRRLTDAQLLAWADDAERRAWDLAGTAEHHRLINLAVEARIIVRHGMARRRPSSVETDILADMAATGFKP